uniref:ShKT domain-containing protein n=1 Tax=Globodera rostochiensis TaxID=31243 RepID=A0A914HQA3_GLORO
MMPSLEGPTPIQKSAAPLPSSKTKNIDEVPSLLGAAAPPEVPSSKADFDAAEKQRNKKQTTVVDPCATAPTPSQRFVCQTLFKWDKEIRAAPPPPPPPPPAAPGSETRDECMDLGCLCRFIGGKGQYSSNICQLANGQPLRKALRKEYRMLTDDERARYHAALKAIKQSGEYDEIAKIHASPAIVDGGAHAGPAFLPWHREYVKRMENALRQVDPTIAIPYWDSSLEAQLPTPADSHLFTKEFMGTTDEQGNLTYGHFANWKTIEGTNIRRRVGKDGKCFNETEINWFLSQVQIDQILAPSAPKDGQTHGGVHTFVGGLLKLPNDTDVADGDMAEQTRAANDPIFFMHHSFVDFLWEMWRQSKQTRENRQTEYPMDNAPLQNRGGLSNKYTDNMYEYAPRPTCQMGPNCGSKLLFCDRSHGQPHCAAKVRPGGNCTGFINGEDVCLNGICQNGQCQRNTPTAMPSLPATTAKPIKPVQTPTPMPPSPATTAKPIRPVQTPTPKPSSPAKTAKPIKPVQSPTAMPSSPATTAKPIPVQTFMAPPASKCPSPSCYNENICCQLWGLAGECNRNPTWMNCFCCVSCGRCIPHYDFGSCTDYNQGCKYWAKAGECGRNEWMLENCRRSCGTCVGFLELKQLCRMGGNGRGKRAADGMPSIDFANMDMSSLISRFVREVNRNRTNDEGDGFDPPLRGIPVVGGGASDAKDEACKKAPTKALRLYCKLNPDEGSTPIQQIAMPPPSSKTKNSDEGPPPLVGAAAPPQVPSSKADFDADAVQPPAGPAPPQKGTVSSNVDPCAAAPSKSQHFVCQNLFKLDKNAREQAARPQLLGAAPSPEMPSIAEVPSPDVGGESEESPIVMSAAPIAATPYECMDLGCLCEYVGGKGQEGSNICQLANGQPLRKALRKEYRMLTDDERARYHAALKAVKKSGEYDKFAKIHSDPITVNGAHSGPAFLPWHREYLKRMEIALRQVDPTIAIPYWDSSLEAQLPTPADSHLFTKEFMGSTDEQGNLVYGHFANWTTNEGANIRRRVGTDEKEKGFTEDEINWFLSQVQIDQILAFSAPEPGITHGGVHTFVGGLLPLPNGTDVADGDMADSPRAANDPIFYMLHSFVDFLWEMWRQSKQTRENRQTEYPMDNAQCASPQHFGSAPMRPFEHWENRDGLSNNYTDNMYEYAPRPNCRMGPNCGSKLLFCDRSHGQPPHCAAKTPTAMPSSPATTAKPIKPVQTPTPMPPSAATTAKPIKPVQAPTLMPLTPATTAKPIKPVQTPNAMRPLIATTAKPIKPVQTPTAMPSSPATTAKPIRPVQSCYNEHECCSVWAQKGECQQNPGYMSAWCKASCQKCQPDYDLYQECNNRHPNCQTWTSQGQCQRNQFWMAENCRQSCGKCRVSRQQVCSGGQGSQQNRG